MFVANAQLRLAELVARSEVWRLGGLAMPARYAVVIPRPTWHRRPSRPSDREAVRFGHLEPHLDLDLREVGQRVRLFTKCAFCRELALRLLENACLPRWPWGSTAGEM